MMSTKLDLRRGKERESIFLKPFLILMDKHQYGICGLNKTRQFFFTMPAGEAVIVAEFSKEQNLK